MAALDTNHVHVREGSIICNNVYFKMKNLTDPKGSYVPFNTLQQQKFTRHNFYNSLIASLYVLGTSKIKLPLACGRSELMLYVSEGS